MPRKRINAANDSTAASDGLPSEYRRATRKLVGTIVATPAALMKPGPFAAMRDEHENVVLIWAVVGPDGKARRIEEWELTLAELSARKVTDLARQVHLLDPYREKNRGDDWRGLSGLKPTAAMDLVLKRTGIATANREPGEEG